MEILNISIILFICPLLIYADDSKSYPDSCFCEVNIKLDII